MTSAEEFTEFAAAVSPRLHRAAFLLCGDWHTAEDLAQTALAKVFVSWRKIARHEATPRRRWRRVWQCGTRWGHRPAARGGGCAAGCR